jgi:hypothetical protein
MAANTATKALVSTQSIHIAAIKTRDFNIFFKKFVRKTSTVASIFLSFNSFSITLPIMFAILKPIHTTKIAPSTLGI